MLLITVNHLGTAHMSSSRVAKAPTHPAWTQPPRIQVNDAWEDLSP